jgi:hypothetical protein
MPLPDPQNRALFTMGRPPGPAGFAETAGDIDLAHHTATNPLRCIRCLHHFPDKLVARNTCKRIIAPRHFKVCAADPSQTHTHKCFAVPGCGDRDIFPKRECPAFQPKNLHCL